MKKICLSMGVVALLTFGFTGCSSDNGDSLGTPITTIEKIGTSGLNGEGASEISAYCKVSNRIFVTNGDTNEIDVFDGSDMTDISKVESLDLSIYGDSVQSVAAKNGKLAVAVGSANKVTTKGKVVIYDISETPYSVESVTVVGYLPDMVTFNEDGSKVIVANEGEPVAKTLGYSASNEEKITTVSGQGEYVDVKGSIGIITVEDATSSSDVTGYEEITFDDATLTAAEDGTAVRLGNTPSNSKAYDLEPEYITVSGDYAYVTLQENNAMAKVNLTNNSLEYVKSYGAKSYDSESGNTIDIEEEGEILMKSYEGLYGLYMPDSIASYTSGGKTYLVTANEGDGREYLMENKDAQDQAACEANTGYEWDDGDKECINMVFLDEKKIKKLDLDNSIASEYEDENELKVMTDLGNTDSDAEYEELYTYGARSFSIWDQDGDLVFDSGDMISKKVAEIEPDLFNQDEEEIDGRSGNKGAEPEAIAVGTIEGRTYAFVGLERQSAIVIYEITSPSNPKYITYVPTHTAGDVSPEGMVFVPASDAPNNKNLLIVSYEMSGSTVVYEIK
jgi:5'-nucleotidase